MPVFVTRPHLPSIERLHSLIDKIYSSEQVTNNGPLLQQLTSGLEAYLGVKNLLLVSSGTIALQLSLKLLKAKGEVITTPFSFPATTSSILWEGCTPVFADINGDNWNLDPELVRKSITSESSAILATHVFGNPCEVSAFEKMSVSNNLPVIYDAAHAFGVVKDNAALLSRGDISVMSFHATKLFHTIEGGAMVIRDDEMFEEAKAMINFGIQGKGEIRNVGINGKMNEFQAAMGLLVLEDIDGIREGYRRAYQRYDRLLDNRLQRQAISISESEYNFSYFPILFESEGQLLKCLSKLEAQEIYPRRYFFPSLDTIEAYGNAGNCAVSQDVASRVLCLPIHAELSEQDQDEICDLINRMLVTG